MSLGSYPPRTILECPNGLIDVYSIAERVRERRALGNGRGYGRLEEVHGDMLMGANPTA